MKITRTIKTSTYTIRVEKEGNMYDVEVKGASGLKDKDVFKIYDGDGVATSVRAEVRGEEEKYSMEIQDFINYATKEGK